MLRGERRTVQPKQITSFGAAGLRQHVDRAFIITQGGRRIVRIPVDTRVVGSGSGQDVSPVSVGVNSGKAALAGAQRRGRVPLNAKTEKDIPVTVCGEGRVDEDG
jgi:hypothetical protein